MNAPRRTTGEETMSNKPANTPLSSGDHEEVMRSFEALRPGRLDREPRDQWRKQRIYQDGRVNELFLMFRQGHALGLAMARD